MYSPRGFELAGLYCIYAFGMPCNERLAKETMMDKARTVTDAKALWGEDPDEKNLCSDSICLNYSHFRVQSYLYLQFLHFLAWTVQTTFT